MPQVSSRSFATQAMLAFDVLGDAAREIDAALSAGDRELHPGMRISVSNATDQLSQACDKPILQTVQSGVGGNGHCIFSQRYRR